MTIGEGVWITVKVILTPNHREACQLGWIELRLTAFGRLS